MVKRYKYEIILFYICSFASLIVATFYDLRINQLLNNPEQPFSLWFYATGEIPARLICPLAGAVIFYLSEKILPKILGFVVCLGGSAYLGYHIAHYMFVKNNNLLFGIVYGIGVGLIIMFVGNYIKIPNVLKKPLLIFAYAGIIAMFVEIGIVEGSKYLWSRLRFRQMLNEGSFDGFTPWYKINMMKNRNPDVKSNEYKSMPSGHTASAGVSYLMMLLPFCFDKFKSKSTLCFIVPFVYTSIVAYTRMVMGAHFLSDITIGAVITFTTVIIVMQITDKKYISKLQNN